MHFDSEEVEKIWEYIDLGEQNKEKLKKRWEIKKNKLKKLEAISESLNHSELRKFIAELTNKKIEIKDQNYKVRKILSELLKESDPSAKITIAHWIITDWGGIVPKKENKESDRTYKKKIIDKLGGFTPHEIDSFVSENLENSPQNRISSWSKILSFVDCTNYAVYDSRTSTALNCALSYIGRKDFFYMPQGAQKNIKSAYSILKNGDDERKKEGYSNKTADQQSYRSYLSLLEEFVSHEKASSMLDAEMILFANGAEVAKKFIESAPTG